LKLQEWKEIRRGERIVKLKNVISGMGWYRGKRGSGDIQPNNGMGRMWSGLKALWNREWRANVQP
jgi:hypothetical protein